MVEGRGEGLVSGRGEVGEMSWMSWIFWIVSSRWEVRSWRREVCCSDNSVKRVCCDSIVCCNVPISFINVAMPSVKVFFNVESTTISPPTSKMMRWDLRHRGSGLSPL